MFAPARVAPLISFVLLLSCDRDRNPIAPEVPDRIPASILATSVLSQNGYAYEYLPAQLSIKVVDAKGYGIGGVSIKWQVTSGTGQICSDKLFPCRAIKEQTGGTGDSGIWFRPESVGTIVVEASVAGVDSIVNFKVEAYAAAASVTIMFGPLFDCTENDPASFVGADSNRNITVPIGSDIDFQYAPYLRETWGCKARLVATSAPEGEELFDSGDLVAGGIYRFSPKVAGRWEFREIYHGGSATITAY